MAAKLGEVEKVERLPRRFERLPRRQILAVKLREKFLATTTFVAEKGNSCDDGRYKLVV